MDDDAFPAYVADRLAGLPAVQAVTLGGSRAEGTHRPDSDWDFSVYYRGRFDPQKLRDIGWPGEVSEVGGWSEGVFNGGAWLEIDNRRTDVHYRDLDVIDREMAAAQEGRFSIEPLMFHLAGIPSYLVLAELSVKRVLRGQLPTPEYPAALRQRAREVWWGRADLTFGYARQLPGSPRPADPVRRPSRPGGIAGRSRGARRARRVDHQREDAAHPRGPAPGR